MIRVRIFRKLYGVDVRPAFMQRFGNAVHAVHHGTVGRENDRVHQLCRVELFHVCNEQTPGERLSLAEHRGIKFADLGKRHSANRKVARKQHEPVDIPGEQASCRRSEVILLAHTGIRYQWLVKAVRFTTQ